MTGCRPRLLGIATAAVLLCLGLVPVLRAATVATDQADYWPGDTVLITGVGFHANEAVTLKVVAVDDLNWPYDGPWTVQTDAEGGFVSCTWIVPDEALGRTFILTADCPDGLHAETTFTDGGQPGAVWTTDSTCVQQDKTPDYLRKGDVYVRSHNLEPGDYWIEVYQTAGDVLIGASAPGVVTADAEGTIGCLWLWGVVHLVAPFDTTQRGYGDSVNQVYRVEVTEVATGKKIKSDNFKVACEPGNPPVIMCPANVTIECDESTIPADTGTATGTDDCDPEVNIGYTDVTTAGTCPVKQVISRVWTATDSGGRTVACTQTIALQDTTAPTIDHRAEDMTVECDGRGNTDELNAWLATNGGASASDNCGAAVWSNDFAGLSDQCGGTGSATVTFTATDDCSNTSSTSATFTVVDKTPPEFTYCPDAVTIECGSPTAPAISATASDACGTVDVTYTDDLVADGCGGTGVLLRTWMAADACGNTATCTQTITIVDTTPPTIACPGAVTVQCAGDVPTPDAGQVAASDTCGNVTVTWLEDRVSDRSCANRYTITRTYLAEDECGNPAVCAQTITVDDRTPPELSNVPTGGDLGCNPEALPSCDARVTATDNCDGPVGVSCTPGAVEGSGCRRRQVLTYAATDTCGNPASADVVYTWQVDNEAPTITCAADATIGCPATPSFPAPTVNDLCDADPVVMFTDARVPGRCAGEYSVTRTWTATDDCGNTSTAAQTINVVDTTAPLIAPLPETTTIACPATPAFALATAVDDCGSAFTLAFEDVTTPGRCAGEYSVTRTWTATDDCGNTSTAAQTINVVDTTAPLIAPLPETTTIACPATPAFALATAVDDCGSALALAFEDVTTPGHCAGEYSVTRTWTATDDCGNASTAAQTINVVDTTAPTLTAGAIGNCYATAAEAEAAAIAATGATDNCGGAVDLGAGTAGDCSAVITVTGTDGCGNAAVVSYSTRIDAAPPVLSGCPPNLTVQCLGDVPPAATVTADDNCDGALTVEFSEDSTGTDCDGTITRTWTARDTCGNATTCSQTVIVKDTTPPVITCPDDVVMSVTDGCSTNPSNTGWATATDNCGGTVTIWYEDRTDAGGTYQTITSRTWYAADACGNDSTCTQIIRCLLPGMVTDSMLCLFDRDPATGDRDLRLLYTPDVATIDRNTGLPCFELTASNPGQYYFNVFYSGEKGSTVDLTITIPFPFVTQGARPIHGYDWVTVTDGPGGLACLLPGDEVYVPVLPPITLDSYGGNQTYTFTLTGVPVSPETGFVYVNMHLDYGLKQSAWRFRSDAYGNALLCGGTSTIIPNPAGYTFGVVYAGSDSGSSSDTVLSHNDFKVIPGVAGLVKYAEDPEADPAMGEGVAGSITSLAGSPLEGVKVSLHAEANGTMVETAIETTTTDEDGFYRILYEHRQKPAYYYVVADLGNGDIHKERIQLKNKGFFPVLFQVPVPGE